MKVTRYENKITFEQPGDNRLFTKKYIMDCEKGTTPRDTTIMALEKFGREYPGSKIVKHERFFSKQEVRQ